MFVKKSEGVGVLDGKPFKAGLARGGSLVKQGDPVLVYCSTKLLAIAKKQGPVFRVNRVFNSQTQ